MVNTMKTIQKPANLFVAAASAVDRQITLDKSVVDVCPLVDELAMLFRRHQPQELSAAVITATCLLTFPKQFASSLPKSPLASPTPFSGPGSIFDKTCLMGR